MGDERPPLGFEYEVAIAKVDTTQTLSYAEALYAPISGSFATIACTRELRCSPPVDQVKDIPLGYNPAALLIPAQSIPGSLTFEANDKPLDLISETYGGQMCVARLKTTMDGTSVTRTWYCSYWVPRFQVRVGDGEEEGRFGGEGMFILLRTA
jgi:hypothetical protein